MVDQSLPNTHSVTSSARKFNRTAVALAVTGLSAIAFQVSAQTNDAENFEEVGFEEVIVTGSARQTIQNSIDLKKASITIVDGMSADEIGDIPALSIGEALETITGAASHRENGGATEISVRGLGPFLGTTVVNGREATNGGGNRAVNYSIFPSEMFNKIAIHKTQSAEYIEGAVSGQVHLDTKKPIEHGKRSVQLRAQGAYAPDSADIEGGQDIGSRFTASYIDQFDFGALGTVGVSIGGQLRDESNPEQEYYIGSSNNRLEACRLASFESDALPTVTGTSRCDTTGTSNLDEDAGVTNVDVAALIGDTTNQFNSVDDIPFAWLARDHRYRQNITSDERESIFTVLQWQPNDQMDFMLDYQYSERDQQEMRHDLQFTSTQEEISRLTSNPYTGIATSVTSQSRLATYTTDFQRLEEYEGFGFNFDYQITDNFKMSVDASYSDTTRTETDVELTMRATPNNESTGSSRDLTTTLDINSGEGVGLATLVLDGDFEGSGFDINDPTYFNATDGLRLRYRQIVRENTIGALRTDFEWNLDNFFTAIKGGARISSLEYVDRGGARPEIRDDELGADATATVLAGAANCANDVFPESGFLGNYTDSLITVTDGSEVRSSGNTYVTFDYDCLGNLILENATTNRLGGDVSAINDVDSLVYDASITSGTTDITEDTLAAYIQADFDADLAGFPIRGNFGVRVVDTEVTSRGYRTPLSSAVNTDGTFQLFEVPNEDGSLEIQSASSGYTEILPSATLIVDLSENLVLRSGIFKGLSRPDPAAYGNGRSLTTNENDLAAFASLSEAVDGIQATGNPYLKPLTSINYDLGIEWYANEDTLISLGGYYKDFKGAFETVAQQEVYNVDGQEITGTVVTTQTSDDSSQLYGLELTATHAFTYLPGFLSGFGGKFSYNYADTNFEYHDGVGGDGITFARDNDGNLVLDDNGDVVEAELIGILDPASLFGLSKHVSATQLYWEGNGFNISAIYKSRSRYFQQYTRDTGNRLRYTAANETLDLRAKYKLNSNVSFEVSGINVTDEPRRDYRGIAGNTMSVLSYGPRYYAGVTVKF